MKKYAAIFMLVLMLTIGTGAFADGISVEADNGDRISILEDIKVLEQVNGSLVGILGDMDVQADVRGDVVAMFGDLIVDSRVRGNVVSIFGNIRLGSQAEVDGDLVSFGTVEKSDEARVHGQEIKIYGPLPDFNMDFLTLARVIMVIVSTGVTFLFGLIALMVFKELFRNISAEKEHGMARKVLIGLLGYLGATILMLLLSITVVAPLAYIVLLLMSITVLSIYLGRLILKSFILVDNLFIEFITGLITITLFKILLIYIIPHSEFLLNITVYMIFTLLLNCLGIGILIDAKYGKERSIN